MPKEIINLSLANPRGFCAGVDRAILIVEKALEKYGAPVYVHHEVVHNKYVINDLNKKGAIFVDSLKDIPKTSHVIFSAHGVSKAIKKQAHDFNLIAIDATCPLVTKVHSEVNKLSKKEHTIIMIGHKGHPEVDGTMGQIDENSPHSEIHLVENIEGVEKLNFINSNSLSYVSQTTLSMDDTKKIIDSLKKKYPSISGPKNDDICYATQNRQEAVKKMLKQHDLIFVIGSKNSSNSNRLVEIAKERMVEAILIDDMSNFKKSWLKNKKNIGITAGASAPEILVQELIREIKKNKHVLISEINGIEENIIFKLPKI
ncbi:4-hydroxy-3-methylbut-2-enyl diphosphate reductase [Methylophilaceae bacterium]|nr:4-hydroxy-3-methylbut-2-enyl diphosphate reductase [Methylophilaceae bacterium]